MSRIIIKNLPKTITAKKLENIFSAKGTITDLQLKYAKDGRFRQFAFVGYKTEEEANSAKEYFNNTFVYTSKIQVDICTNLGDPNKPKSWKKINAESKALKSGAGNKDILEDKKDKTKKKKQSEDIPEELLNDAQFKEFLEINKDRKSKPVWAEDIEADPEAEPDSGDAGSSSDSDYDLNYNELKEKDEESTKESTKTKKREEKNLEKLKNKECANKEDQSNKESPSKKNNAYDTSFTVKLRNLPFKCKKKQIKEFFQNLKIKSLRIPPKQKGFAYVQFKTEKDMKQALNKNKGFLDGHRVDVIKYTKKFADVPKYENQEQTKRSAEENLELLAETGRIYVRNLCFTVVENEIEQLFSKYGPLSEIHLPIDLLTKKAQGFAFVSYVFAEHAVKAFTELDGTIFQGRLLHLIPANPKKEYQIDDNETNYKKKKEAKMKQMSGSSHNWNILFLGMNAVADVIAEKYNIEKSKLLSGDSKENLAVRLALAETEMVMDSRKFLMQNGVQLDAFSQPAAERSKTVIVVKNLPSKSTAEELKEIFEKFGTLSKVILPPSGLIALVEYESPTEAKMAFKRLAYSRFRNVPLYLEWAPVDAIKEPPPELTPAPAENSNADIANDATKKDEEEAQKQSETSQLDAEEPAADTTIFVRNINFDTTQEGLKNHFKQCGPIHYAAISTKTDAKTGKLLSMGFGFVQFKKRESAVQAIQNLQGSKLDEHALELKFAKRDLKPQSEVQKRKYEVKKQKSAKILVRNIPFQASEKEVRELFSKLGMLKSIRLPKKSDGSGEHRGFGFVEYCTKDNAERAFNALCHSTHFFGRRLVLEWANPDSEDVDELRKKTARDYTDGKPKKKVKKRKLNEDVALTAAKYDREDD